MSDRPTPYLDDRQIAAIATIAARASMATLEGLIALVASPDAAKKRLDELAEVKRRETQLAADREAFEEHRLRVVAELERDGDALARRWGNLALREHNDDFDRAKEAHRRTASTDA
jgi:hypothetical protein